VRWLDFRTTLLENTIQISRRQLDLFFSTISILDKSLKVPTTTFGQSPFRTYRQIFKPGFVVVIFVDWFEMEIVQKGGLVQPSATRPRF